MFFKAKLNKNRYLFNIFDNISNILNEGIIIIEKDGIYVNGMNNNQTSFLKLEIISLSLTILFF